MLLAQPLDNLRRHHLIQGAGRSLKEGIETATEHIIIEVISTDPGPISANRLVSEELQEHVQGAAVKAGPFTHYRIER